MPRFCGDIPVTSTPSKRTLPLLPRMKPVMKPSVVVLPQPDGPTSATSSPWPTVRWRSCTAASWPYSTVRPSMSSFMGDSSASDRSAQPADADEAALQEREDRQHRHERDEAAGRQERPVDAVADLLDVALERHGVRLGGVLGDQDER